MNTKYGDIPPTLTKVYKDILINRVFKILPLKEENYSTVNEHIDSVSSEIFGFSAICNNLSDASKLISVVNLLEHVRVEIEHKAYRREILKCCNLIKKVGDCDAE